MCKYILFTYPFGWDELGVVASVLGVIATVWAVSVALKANRNANEQLQSALKIQEQAKNVELLDRRMEMITQVSEKEKISIRYLKVFFDDTIMSKYKEMIGYECDKSQAESDIRYYFQELRESDGRGGSKNDIQATIDDYKRRLIYDKENVELWKEYEQFCCDNALVLTKSGREEDRKLYNYYELENLRSEKGKLADTARKELIKLMEKYVEDGIKPLM